MVDIAENHAFFKREAISVFSDMVANGFEPVGVVVGIYRTEPGRCLFTVRVANNNLDFMVDGRLFMVAAAKSNSPHFGWFGPQFVLDRIKA